MTDEQDKAEEEQTQDEAANPVGGERLAAARREQQISVLEVAKELHLDEPKVRALESNQFELLGAPVFAKGHLRKYAQLVGVPEDDVFADYYQLTRAERMPPIVVGRTKARQELSPGPWIAVIIVLLAAAAAYWWFGVREPAPVATAPEPVEEATPDAAISEESADEPVVIAAATPAEITEPAAAEIEDEAPVEEAALAAGEIRLSLAFSGDCWTEISDANGRRLFFGMGRDGRNMDLTGPAPFTVLLGNADNVAVRLNGDPYTIPASSRSNRTARLTILQP